VDEIKKHGNLYGKIIDIGNLNKASKQAKKSIDKDNLIKMKQVEYFENNKGKLLLKLRNDLKNRKFTTNEYNIYTINDRGKTREIYDLPFYPDRIVHWAMLLQTEEIFKNLFIHDSYAAIKGKGGHKSLKRARKWIIENPEETRYCLKIDIKKFFPNIKQNILYNLIKRKFKDKDLLWLFEDIIYSTKSGLPIGNLTSQYLGNYYTNWFDYYCKHDLKIEYMQKYMDDYIFFSNSKDELRRKKYKMDKYLKDNLGLKIKGNWQIFPTRVRGIDFIGYRNFGEYVLLRKSIVKKYKTKMNGYLKFAKYNRYITKNMYISINSYGGWLQWCNSYDLYTKYTKPLEPYLEKYHREMILNESTINSKT